MKKPSKVARKPAKARKHRNAQSKSKAQPKPKTQTKAKARPKSRKKPKPLVQGTIKPYREIRKDLFSHGDASAKLPPPPARPLDLDARLPAKVLEDLALYGHTDSTKSELGLNAYTAVVVSILGELNQLDSMQNWYQLLSPARRTVILVNEVDSEINNGGFDQYYLNSSGGGALLAPDALRALGLKDVAKLVESANKQFPGGPSPVREAILAQMDALPESAASAWQRLDDKYFDRTGDNPTDLCVKFILANPAEFFNV